MVISLRMLVYTGTGKTSDQFISGSVTERNYRYQLELLYCLNIPYKKIKVILKKEVKEEPEETPTHKYNGTIVLKPLNNREADQTVIYVFTAFLLKRYSPQMSATR